MKGIRQDMDSSGYRDVDIVEMIVIAHSVEMIVIVR